MRKTFATTLLVIVLATPAFAAVKSDPDRRTSDRSTSFRCTFPSTTFMSS